MKINVGNIIDMWNRKNYSSEERSADLRSILNHFKEIRNFSDLGILTINIHKVEENEIIRDICVRC